MQCILCVLRGLWACKLMTYSGHCYSHMCTHVQWETILLDDLGAAYKAHLQLTAPIPLLFGHGLTFQNPYVVTDMRRQLLGCTCEFNRSKFRRNCSDLPVHFHQWQQYHANSFSKLMVRYSFLNGWWIMLTAVWHEDQSAGLEADSLSSAHEILTSGLHGSLWILVLTFLPSQSSCLLLSLLCRMDPKRSWCRGFLFKFPTPQLGLTLVRCCAHHCLQLCSFLGQLLQGCLLSSSTFS